MIFYYMGLSISGENFYPERIINDLDIDNKLTIENIHNPEDISYLFNKAYGYGLLDLVHKNKLCNEEGIFSYQNVLFNFLKKNINILENRTDIDFFLNVYFTKSSADISSFFNMNLIKFINFYNINLVVDLFNLPIEKILDSFPDCMEL